MEPGCRWSCKDFEERVSESLMSSCRVINRSSLVFEEAAADAQRKVRKVFLKTGRKEILVMWWEKV